MPYTEIKQRNKKKYYYRVRTIRNRKKFKKNRIYLGKNLPKKELHLKEKKADHILTKKQTPPKYLQKIIPKIKRILIANQVKRAGIFGSYAIGKQKSKSDIDILVRLPKNMSLLGFSKIKTKIEDKIDRKVDLVEYNTIKQQLKKKILEEEIRII